MTDQHEPGEHPANDAAAPGDHAGSDGAADRAGGTDDAPGTDRAPGGAGGDVRRAARPPVGEGATVPLRQPPPPPPAAEPGAETPIPGTPSLPGPLPAAQELPPTAGRSDGRPRSDDVPTPIGSPAAGPGPWPPPAVERPAAAPRPAAGSGAKLPVEEEPTPAGASAAEPDDWFPAGDERELAAPGTWRPEDDEATTRLTPPLVAPAVDDEPTVERPRPALRDRPDDGGETRRLRPPTVVPGPSSDTPGPDASEGAARPGAASSPMSSASDALDGEGQTGASPRRDEARTASGVAGDDAADDDLPDTDHAARARDEDGAGGSAAVSPDEVTAGEDGPGVPAGSAPGVPGKDWPFKKFVSAGVLIWVLLALFGFTLVVQLRSNNSDEGLASARQDDLVRILSDLEARDTRLQAEISALETSQRQLTSGVAGRQAALAEAEKRADELGLLAGTVPGRGRGLQITIDGVRASAVLNAVQELRGAGGEVMQLTGTNGEAVRIVASTYFVDAEGGGIVADGKRLTGPYRLLVIGVPQTMQTALEIPGGVVASVKSGGGSVTMEQRNSVDVTALREATSLQYARPVS